MLDSHRNRIIASFIPRGLFPYSQFLGRSSVFGIERESTSYSPNSKPRCHTSHRIKPALAMAYAVCSRPSCVALQHCLKVSSFLSKQKWIFVPLALGKARWNSEKGMNLKTWAHTNHCLVHQGSPLLGRRKNQNSSVAWRKRDRERCCWKSSATCFLAPCYSAMLQFERIPLEKSRKVSL